MAGQVLRRPAASRPGRRRAAVAAALVVAALAATGSSASGDGLDDLPPAERFNPEGAVANNQGVVVRPSKTFITMGKRNPLWGLLYYAEWNACGTGRGATWCPPGRPPESHSPSLRVGWPFATPFMDQCVMTRPEDQTTQYVRSKLVLVTTKRVNDKEKLDKVGDLAPVPVQLVAFGSIPVTATLRMSMVREGGRAKPWVVHVWNPTGFGPRDPESFCRAAEYYHTLIEGQVNLRLENLRVDGRPVPLGASCRSSQPVDLDLWGEKGYNALAGGMLSQHEDHPLGEGTVRPLRTPGYPDTRASIYFEDEGRTLPPSKGIDVPPFTGCGVSEDLDPLVNAMAAGPNNPLRVRQGLPMQSGIDINDIARCDAPDRCPETPSLTPEDMPPLPAEDR